MARKTKDAGDERAFVVFSRIVGAIREQVPLNEVKQVNMEIPEGYPVSGIRKFFGQLGILLSAKAVPGGALRVRDVLLR
jgi:hypothetical protein